MRTITHRELRNDSSRILREVQAGEMIEVTNHGEVAAILVPPHASSYDRLVLAGRIQKSSGHGVDLTRVKRGRSTRSTQDMVDDLRDTR